MKTIRTLILMFLMIVLSACSLKKEAIDDEEFIGIMTNENFEIVNVEKQFEQYGYFDESFVALHKSGNYQIEFYELEDESYALKFYNNNKSIFEKSNIGSTVYTNVDLKNTNKYTLTTEKEYKVISRIDDTVIYLDVDKKYKEEVNNILKKLGY